MTQTHLMKVGQYEISEYAPPNSNGLLYKIMIDIQSISPYKATVYFNKYIPNFGTSITPATVKQLSSFDIGDTDDFQTKYASPADQINDIIARFKQAWMISEYKAPAGVAPPPTYAQTLDKDICALMLEPTKADGTLGIAETLQPTNEGYV